jgi:GrpB-like predicted nucleotidyltransferase (UPF0157 family)
MSWVATGKVPGMTFEAPVVIVPYDSRWPMRFLEEANILRPVLAPWLAGPIDIMAGVHTLEESRPAIAAATALGYCYAPYQADLEHWFCKPSPAFRTHHLHLIPLGRLEWLRPIAFRDYIRAHSEIAVEYEDLKRQLAEKHPLDREAYTEGKRAFIDRVANIALEAGYGSRHQT